MAEISKVALYAVVAPVKAEIAKIVLYGVTNSTTYLKTEISKINLYAVTEIVIPPSFAKGNMFMLF